LSKIVLFKKVLTVRIHFGIYAWNVIKWPERCLWCGGEVHRWLKISKKTIYDFRYRIFWFNLLSRQITLSYPVCKKHYFIGRLGDPFLYLSLALAVVAFLLEADLNSPHWWSLIFITLFVVGIIYFRRNYLLIHRVNENFVEISIPDGQYAKDFALLNNCNEMSGHLLMQDTDLNEIIYSDSLHESHFQDDRIMCSDESCIGTMEDGKCRECGRKI